MTLKIYVDRLSQPCRAVIIFCKVNGIDFEEIYVDISKRGHLSPEFLAINPLHKVPAIVHGSFKLFESHAILTYLVSAFPGVPDHWYPTDLYKRAEIDSYLHWHHYTIRQGAAYYIFHGVYANVLNYPLNPQVAAECMRILKESLPVIESVWMKGNGKFLLGNEQPSIADISLACEIMQLEMLTEEERKEILGPYKRILRWVEDIRVATSPHFEEAHDVILACKASFYKLPPAENYDSMSSIKGMVPSEL